MTIKKPEPVILQTINPGGYWYGHVYGYSGAQLEAYAQARVDEALEEIEAFVVRHSALDLLTDTSTVNSLLSKIRALKGKV